MADELAILDDLHYSYAALHIMRENGGFFDPSEFSRLRLYSRLSLDFYYDRLSDDGLLGFVPPVRLVRTRHNSPGFQDLAGVGEALKQIRESIKDYRERHETKREAVARADSAEQDAISKRIKNLRDMADLCKEVGMSQDETRAIISRNISAEEGLEKMVDRGMITGARLIDGEEAQKDTNVE